jgi:hypothetical protein
MFQKGKVVKDGPDIFSNIVATWITERHRRKFNVLDSLHMYSSLTFSYRVCIVGNRGGKGGVKKLTFSNPHYCTVFSLKRCTVFYFIALFLLSEQRAAESNENLMGNIHETFFL